MSTLKMQSESIDKCKNWIKQIKEIIERGDFKSHSGYIKIALDNADIELKTYEYWITEKKNDLMNKYIISLINIITRNCNDCFNDIKDIIADRFCTDYEVYGKYVLIMIERINIDLEALKKLLR